MISILLLIFVFCYHPCIFGAHGMLPARQLISLADSVFKGAVGVNANNNFCFFDYETYEMYEAPVSLAIKGLISLYSRCVLWQDRNGNKQTPTFPFMQKLTTTPCDQWRPLIEQSKEEDILELTALCLFRWIDCQDLDESCNESDRDKIKKNRADLISALLYQQPDNIHKIGPVRGPQRFSINEVLNSMVRLSK